MPRRIPTYRPPSASAGLPRHRPPESRSDRSAEHQRFLNSRAWRRASKLYLIEHPTCHDCDEVGIIEPATQVHHRIKPGGDYELLYGWPNLMGLCRSCHSRRTARGE